MVRGFQAVNDNPCRLDSSRYFTIDEREEKKERIGEEGAGVRESKQGAEPRGEVR